MLVGFEPLMVAVAIATFLLAGFVKGVIGLGLPTVSMGLLTVVMAPAQAAAFLIVPSLVTNAWQLVGGPSFSALARRLWPMMAGIALGTLAGAGFMVGTTADYAVTGLGLALVAYAVIGLAAVRFSVGPGTERWMAPIIGVATGLITAATGVFVLPAVPYLSALALSKDDLIQALGLSFTVSTLALAGALVIGGSLQASIAGGSLLALAPAMLGMVLGGWVRDRISEKVFRRFFFTGLLFLGAHLVWRGLA